MGGCCSAGNSAVAGGKKNNDGQNNRGNDKNGGGGGGGNGGLAVAAAAAAKNNNNNDGGSITPLIPSPAVTAAYTEYLARLRRKGETMGLYANNKTIAPASPAEAKKSARRKGGGSTAGHGAYEDPTKVVSVEEEELRSLQDASPVVTIFQCQPLESTLRLLFPDFDMDAGGSGGAGSSSKNNNNNDNNNNKSKTLSVKQRIQQERIASILQDVLLRQRGLHGEVVVSVAHMAVCTGVSLERCQDPQRPLLLQLLDRSAEETAGDRGTAPTEPAAATAGAAAVAAGEEEGAEASSQTVSVGAGAPPSSQQTLHRHNGGEPATDNPDGRRLHGSGGAGREEGVSPRNVRNYFVIVREVNFSALAHTTTGGGDGGGAEGQSSTVPARGVGQSACVANINRRMPQHKQQLFLLYQAFVQMVRRWVRVGANSPYVIKCIGLEAAFADPDAPADSNGNNSSAVFRPVLQSSAQSYNGYPDPTTFYDPPSMAHRAVNAQVMRDTGSDIPEAVRLYSEIAKYGSLDLCMRSFHESYNEHRKEFLEAGKNSNSSSNSKKPPQELPRRRPYAHELSARALMQQALAGLAYLHENGELMHDVSLENMFLNHRIRRYYYSYFPLHLPDYPYFSAPAGGSYYSTVRITDQNRMFYKKIHKREEMNQFVLLSQPSSSQNAAFASGAATATSLSHTRRSAAGPQLQRPGVPAALLPASTQALLNNYSLAINIPTDEGDRRLLLGQDASHSAGPLSPGTYHAKRPSLQRVGGDGSGDAPHSPLLSSPLLSHSPGTVSGHYQDPALSATSAQLSSVFNNNNNNADIVDANLLATYYAGGAQPPLFLTEVEDPISFPHGVFLKLLEEFNASPMLTADFRGATAVNLMHFEDTSDAPMPYPADGFTNVLESDSIMEGADNNPFLPRNAAGYKHSTSSGNKQAVGKNISLVQTINNNNTWFGLTDGTDHLRDRNRYIASAMRLLPLLKDVPSPAAAANSGATLDSTGGGLVVVVPAPAYSTVNYRYDNNGGSKRSADGFSVRSDSTHGATTAATAAATAAGAATSTNAAASNHHSGSGEQLNSYTADDGDGADAANTATAAVDDVALLLLEDGESGSYVNHSHRDEVRCQPLADPDRERSAADAQILSNAEAADERGDTVGSSFSPLVKLSPSVRALRCISLLLHNIAHANRQQQQQQQHAPATLVDVPLHHFVSPLHTAPEVLLGAGEPYYANVFRAHHVSGADGTLGGGGAANFSTKSDIFALAMSVVEVSSPYGVTQLERLVMRDDPTQGPVLAQAIAALNGTDEESKKRRLARRSAEYRAALAANLRRHYADHLARHGPDALRATWPSVDDGPALSGADTAVPLPRHLSAKLRALLARCLHPDPFARPAAAELLRCEYFVLSDWVYFQDEAAGGDGSACYTNDDVDCDDDDDQFWGGGDGTGAQGGGAKGRTKPHRHNGGVERPWELDIDFDRLAQLKGIPSYVPPEK